MNCRDRMFGLLLCLALALSGCGSGEDAATPEIATEAPPIGTWRAVLDSPGGELPFTLRLSRQEGALRAVVLNGEEEVPFGSVMRVGDHLVLGMEWYDSRIEADLEADGRRMTGLWTKTVPGRFSTLPFSAVLDDERRFVSLAEAALERGVASAPATVKGVWDVSFVDDEGVLAARGEFWQAGERVTGTFLTPTGDYRYLDGSYEDGVLRLSTFDGAHAFLFQAWAVGEASLEGDFWSRDSYHATWTARRREPSQASRGKSGNGAAEAGRDESDPGETQTGLPDPWQMVGVASSDGAFRFRFPDATGNMLSSANRRFRNKVVIVNIFGTWCPNCNDEAPLLADWDRRYRRYGLEVVGLAFEFSGDPARDQVMLERFAARHDIDYPLLLAGVSDKALAAAALPDLTSVIAYPTTILIGRDGKVRAIHTGFSGPGTGEHYRSLVDELERRIEALLAEPS